RLQGDWSSDVCSSDLPVAQADQLFLHAGFLHRLVASLHDRALFAHVHVLADLAGFGLHDRDALDDVANPFAHFGDAFGFARLVHLVAALPLVGGALRGVLLRDAFGDGDRPECRGGRSKASQEEPQSRRRYAARNDRSRHAARDRRARSAGSVEWMAGARGNATRPEEMGALWLKFHAAPLAG